MQVELAGETRQRVPVKGAQTPPQAPSAKAVDMAKWVYTFGDGAAEGASEMRNLLGGKGANLAEMANLGLPVPPGFTISTEACRAYLASGWPAGLDEEIREHMALMERTVGHRFDLADFGQALATFNDPGSGAIKIIVAP